MSAASILANGLDVRQPLLDCLAEGASYVPEAITENFRTGLLREVGSLPLESAPLEVGSVNQQMELYVAHGAMECCPAMRDLCESFASLIQRSVTDTNLRQWRPNLVDVQRYVPGSVGISPHLDSRQYVFLIAIFTIAGRAQFSMYQMRDGGPLATWTVVPDSVVLLRGTVPAGPDTRIFHAVSGPLDALPRISVTLRMRLAHAAV